MRGGKAMSVNNVLHSAQVGLNTYKKNIQAGTVTSPAEEESNKTSANSNSDSFARSIGEHRIDMDKVNAMRANITQNVSAFRQMVQALLGNQIESSLEASGDILVDEETQANAKEAISEDGFWGVEQTATRILDFAKALAGGNPEKISLLHGAVMSGFNLAQHAWGGNLPDISQQTLTRIHEGFAEWKASAA
jgi:hypothetical protein